MASQGGPTEGVSPGFVSRVLPKVSGDNFPGGGGWGRMPSHRSKGLRLSLCYISISDLVLVIRTKGSPPPCRMQIGSAAGGEVSALEEERRKAEDRAAAEQRARAQSEAGHAAAEATAAGGVFFWRGGGGVSVVSLGPTMAQSTLRPDDRSHRFFYVATDSPGEMLPLSMTAPPSPPPSAQPMAPGFPLIPLHCGIVGLGHTVAQWVRGSMLRRLRARIAGQGHRRAARGGGGGVPDPAGPAGGLGPGPE